MSVARVWALPGLGGMGGLRAEFAAGTETPHPSHRKKQALPAVHPNSKPCVSLLEAPPGSTSVRHFHYGDEVFYVLEGAMIQVPGQESQARVTGSVGYNKRETPHAGYTVIGDKPLKLLSMYIVDKG